MTASNIAFTLNGISGREVAVGVGLFVTFAGIGMSRLRKSPTVAPEPESRRPVISLFRLVAIVMALVAVLTLAAIRPTRSIIDREKAWRSQENVMRLTSICLEYLEANNALPETMHDLVYAAENAHRNIRPYLKSPFDPDSKKWSYVLAVHGKDYNPADVPDNKFIVIYEEVGGPYKAVGFLDGHVESLQKAAAEKLIAGNSDETRRQGGQKSEKKQAIEDEREKAQSEHVQTNKREKAVSAIQGRIKAIPSSIAELKQAYEKAMRDGVKLDAYFWAYVLTEKGEPFTQKRADASQQLSADDVFAARTYAKTLLNAK